MDNQITVEDLARIKTIIEISCGRGAFQAAEMKTVGEVYDRLSAFLDTVMAQAQTQPEIDQGESQ